MTQKGHLTLLRVDAPQEYESCFTPLFSFVVHFTPPVFQCISQACSHGLEKDENPPDNRKSLIFKVFPVCP